VRDEAAAVALGVGETDVGKLVTVGENVAAGEAQAAMEKAVGGGESRGDSECRGKLGSLAADGEDSSTERRDDKGGGDDSECPGEPAQHDDGAAQDNSGRTTGFSIVGIPPSSLFHQGICTSPFPPFPHFPVPTFTQPPAPTFTQPPVPTFTQPPVPTFTQPPIQTFSHSNVLTLPLPPPKAVELFPTPSRIARAT
jgi:hypothetical protein